MIGRRYFGADGDRAGRSVGRTCMAAIEAADGLLISVGTVAAALIVARCRNLGDEIAAPIEGLGFENVSVIAASAHWIAEAYGRWGKGVHPAGLNYGDCFAYEVAVERDCLLAALYRRGGLLADGCAMGSVDAKPVFRRAGFPLRWTQRRSRALS